ncbi:MAG: class I SAM-dependent methyltransferase [Coriobacteriia bacterium]
MTSGRPTVDGDAAIEQPAQARSKTVELANVSEVLHPSIVEVYESGSDHGWLGHRNYNWWFDSSEAHAFEIYDLDAFYPEDYYADDHVQPTIVGCVVDCVLAVGESVIGRPVSSVLELGCAGGWFTYEYLSRGVEVQAIEGARVGFERTLSRGVPLENVLHKDLRLPLDLNRKYDIAMCTEVAEHVEPPLAGTLVHNITRHSDLVWFSFEPPDTNEAHLHHCNEQPTAFWQNLFRFFGFGMVALPQDLLPALDLRGGYIRFREHLAEAVEAADVAAAVRSAQRGCAPAPPP